MGRPRQHVFVCVYRRPEGERPEAGRPSCGARGGGDVLAALRDQVAARPDLLDVAVTGCECLGPCFDGPNLVVYPDRIWYAQVSPADAGDIATEHLAAGRPVERLAYRFVDEDEDENNDGEPGESNKPGERDLGS